MALNKYRMSLSSIDGLASAQGADKEVLVPVTTALYLPGKINKVQSVLVEVGTGYFVEKQLDAAQTFIKTKIDMCEKNIGLVTEEVTKKRNNLNVVAYVMQQKISQAQQSATSKLDSLKPVEQ